MYSMNEFTNEIARSILDNIDTSLQEPITTYNFQPAGQVSWETYMEFSGVSEAMQGQVGDFKKNKKINVRKLNKLLIN